MARVLCVDDEPNVLEGLARTLSEHFDVVVATSGEEGLLKMAAEPFAVVVSDMRMPGMNGAAFLSRARTLAPDSVRMLLTGHSDIESAIAAVNDGAIFRFLSKPCPSKILLDTVACGANQYRLLSSERELLDGTLRGLVKLLTDVLAVASPTVFSRTTRIRNMASHAAKKLGLADPWQLEIAALLSQLGCIALPEELVARVLAGQTVSAADAAAFDAHPATAARLLATIPRLDVVTAIIAGHLEAKAPAGPEPVEMGAAILRAATTFDDLRSRGATREAAIAEMRLSPQTLDRHVIEALESYRVGVDCWTEQSLRVEQLATGMLFEEDVLSSAGSVLVCKGTELTSVTLERLRRFASGAGVREPIRVRAAVDGFAQRTADI